MKLLFEKDCKKTQPDPFMFEADGKYYMYVTAGRGVEAYNAEINRLTACLMDAETIGGLLHD